MLFTGVGLLAGLSARQDLARSTGESLTQLADNLALSLDTGLFERQRETENLAALEHMADQPLTPQAWRALLERMQSSLPQYSWIGVADARGTVLASTGGLLQGKDVSGREWFLGGLKAPFTSDVHEAKLLAKLVPPPSPGEPLRLLDFAAPLLRQGQVTGVVGAHLSWAWTQERCRLALAALEPSAGVQVTVLDRQARVLLGPEAPQAWRREPAQLENLVRKRHGVVEWDDGRPYLTAAVRSHGYKDYAGFGWVVVMRQPLDTALAPAHDLQRRIGIMGAVAAVLFGLLGWALAHRLTLPLRRLAAQAHAVSRELGLRLPAPPGGDEVAGLAQALGSLVAQLRQRQQELHALNEALEARVTERTDSLRQANIDLESFSRSISHDLKGPIGTMGLLVHSLLGDRPERFDAQARRILSAVVDECARLRQLVEEMLALSMVEHRPLKFKRVSMQAAVDAVIADLRAGMGMDGQAWVAATQAAVGPLPEVEGDEVLLRQVWHNLLSNAFKFSAKVESPRVEVTAERSSNEIIFTVRDNGAGFDPQRAGELFGTHQRLHSQEEFGGSGVGLSIVKRIVQRHGGRVGCRGEVGRGAEFFFTLPCLPGDEHAPSRASVAELA